MTIISGLCFNACKNEPDPVPSNPSSDKCASKTITVQAAITNTSKCSTVGKLVVSARGSKGFTYQLNNGAFQADSTFNNLVVGSYTVTVKDADGCTKSGTFAIAEDGTKGPNYTFVSNIIAAKCNGSFCHATGQDGAPTSALNTDCNIISRKALIKSKAVDGTMGNLTSGEKQQINIWINAGGRYTD